MRTVTAQRSPDRKLQKDAHWYRANYLLAVAYESITQLTEHRSKLAHRRRELEENHIDPEVCAQTHVALVARPLEARLLVLTRPGAKLSKRERALRDFLRTLEPTVLLLFAGIVRRWGQPPAAGAETYDALLWSRRLARLSRLRSAAFRKGSQASSGPDRAQIYETVLGTAGKTDDDVVKQLLDYIKALDLDYRARYNFACFLAGPGAYRDYEQAFLQLESALKTAPADLKVWAKGDPSLEGLREDSKFEDSVNKLLAGERTGQRLGMS